MRRKAILANLMIVVSMIGCRPVAGVNDRPFGSTSHGGPVRDHVTLVDNLRGEGLTVDIVGPVSRPFLHASGTILRISGGQLAEATELESFNYDDTDLNADGAAVAAEDAVAIMAGGQPPAGSDVVSEPAHWFRAERVIVLYRGDDRSMVDLLASVLGPPFAER